jgi:hypothetical protein
MRYIIFFSLLLFIGACQPTNNGQRSTDNHQPTTNNRQPSTDNHQPPSAKALPASSKTFDTTDGLSKYWYEGKAEISRYELQQNRYRDVHPGEAVLIFVTEDFLTDKQVKNDNYTNPNSVPILKTNMMRTFPTGVYNYSIMTSVFTPVGKAEYPNTLKVTTSAQDWCGHAYMQLNLEKDGYRSTVHSYFENEADSETKVPVRILEDELFNRIRINPDKLPVGEHEVLPGTVITRLRHLPFAPLKAQLALSDYTGSDFEGENLKSYTIEYPTLNRVLEIVFENTSPYDIAGWKDSYPSAFDRKVRTTIAKKTHQVKQAYWSKNSLEDMELRARLGLE